MTLKIGDVFISDKENLFFFISIFFSDAKTKKGSTMIYKGKEWSSIQKMTK